jgi:menaquinone-dependent protoporphyrinogen IX oxidase
MNTIILYQSKYGHTKRYAEMIANEIECEAKPYKKAIKDDLSTYDQIVFGTGVYMGKMKKLTAIKKRFHDRPITIFACGGNNNIEKDIETIKDKNFTETELAFHHFFYLPGGMDLSKMGGLMKLWFKLIEKMLTSKKDKTPDEDAFLDSLQNPKDYVDKKHIADIVAWLKNND